MKKRIIIPARYGSTRLPAKLLIEVAGKAILHHTYERALACHFDSVLIATDHPDIVALCNKIGAPCCLTRESHINGTDRISEAMNQAGYSDEDVIVNLQGDEPLLPVANILRTTENLIAHPEASVATLCKPLEEKSDIFNPNYVKVVVDHNDYALYFSRAPVPWARDYFPATIPDTDQGAYSHHIGLYVYRGIFLKRYASLPPCVLETTEQLEQLRALYYGFKIHVGLAPEKNPPGVDTAASLQEIRRLLEN